jgi:hypothetical protein
MASSALDSAIKQALQNLKKESARLTIECQLKKHLTIIKDLIGSGLSLAIIADRLSQAGVTGNTKDIIAAINALVGAEASIALGASGAIDGDGENDDQINNSPQTPIIKTPLAKKQPKSTTSVGAQESPSPLPSIAKGTSEAIQFVEENATILPSPTPATEIAASENQYAIPNRRSPEVEAKLQAAKAQQMEK